MNRSDGEADADRRWNLAAFGVNGLGEGGRNSSGNRHARAEVAVGEHHDELVAADSSGCRA